jgi:ribosomal protein S15P/S13E
MPTEAISIHPRAAKKGEKKNTCGPKSNARLIKAVAGLERHLDANPNDAAGQIRLANLNKRINGG